MLIDGLNNGEVNEVWYARGIDPSWDSTGTTPVWGYQFLRIEPGSILSANGIRPAIQLLESSEAMLNYYSAAGTTQSAELIRNAEESFKVGAIGQLEYLRLIDHLNALQRGKMDSIFNYNKAALYIQYLNGFAS